MSVVYKMRKSRRINSQRAEKGIKLTLQTAYVDRFKAAHDESQVDLHCLPSLLSIFKMIQLDIFSLFFKFADIASLVF